MPNRNLSWEGNVDTLLAEATKTSDGNTDGFDGWGPCRTIRAQLRVSALSGAGTILTVKLQDTLDGSNWNDIGSFSPLSAVGRDLINITTPFGNVLRAVWTFQGSAPSATFEILALGEP